MSPPLADALPRLADGGPHGNEATDCALNGLVCASYGLIYTFGDGDKFPLVHGFDHAIAARGVQQGAAHAVVAPAVLEYVFEHVDGNRDLLVSAFGTAAADSDATADAVIAAMADLRGASGARRHSGTSRRSPQRSASTFDIPNGLAGLEPSEEDLRGVLDAAW